MINENMKEWYKQAYPTDEVGGDLYNNVTLGELYKTLEQGADVYSTTGITDSLVRERVFNRLSEALNVSYEQVYQLWINGR